MASLLAAVGFFVIPAKRSKGKAQMRQKIAELRERLGRALTEQFTKEIARSSDRIRTSIAPYSRFVRAEGETLERSELELNDALSAIASLRYRIESAGATVLQS